ncbi:hypothetical protein [Rahnella sp. ChDrAdgB13]|uniref:hypothetical protein n=1 Tax=Rahnella sp. ChDrAdgB13 TaxID=1850581 RepID=UPI001AD85668|nr:hypothetical protein [Rahnella sp. ChDrAdgB13]
MSEVKRYKQIVGGLQESADGDWVDYDDYQKLVAENAALHGRIDSVIGIIENSDNRYCMCGATIEPHKLGGCGSPMGVFDHRYNSWIKHFTETLATDAAIAEMRNEWKAQGVDDFKAWSDSHIEEGDEHEESLREVSKALSIFAANLRAGRKCNIPPAGWRCTRAAGHEGPCAAVEDASHE